ncbi:type I phosphomannose isomerase catalytic subunit [Alicyclobacillus cycloheptanicus]|uniref:Mannose-6-phosphate isomerase n=1 Tax=Alicyclobacillus cycloheptanicus TaxID=1457 RepID=A0ABT9XF56_9BACL|nr:type I phosphomannose isomerase catalytic subunit [Alicyclobacillus cycloheptanicus]MDQ0188917.1 mannose-6-phosphate isomerase [Alicyclobacillus cycloheptanicus]
MQPYPVKFKPIPQERIWGGHEMKPVFHADRISEPIGEYWLVSGHPTALSVVENGPLAGKSLNELTAQFPDAYLGASPQPRFPVLIKLIEAQADLSVQVHPDDLYAQAHEGDFGKSEAWYIVKAPASGQVVYGHRFRSRDEYFRAVEEGHVRDYLGYRNVAQGDLVYVPARTLHALLAGTTLIEVQQTSDVTYRVYDWDRVDQQGKPRALHVNKAADVLNYAAAPETTDGPAAPRAVAGGTCELLIRCPYFQIERLQLASGAAYSVESGDAPVVLIGVSGTGRLSWPGAADEQVRPYHPWMVPACMTDAVVRADEPMVLLQVTYGRT